MRGKVLDLIDDFNQNRITPAYAGKSSVGSSRTSQGRDHPRLCGEKAKVEQDKPKVLGSPPPMRGKAT